MANCEICGKECNGKTCSGACRAKLSRRTDAHAHGQERTRTVAHAEERTVDQPAVAQPVTLSDGQQWTPDPEPGLILESWGKGQGTAYQQQLANLSQQYETIKGNEQPQGAWSC